MRKLLIFVLLACCYACQERKTLVIDEPLDSPSIQARDRLVQLHPLWRTHGYGADKTFFHRGYLTTKKDFEPFCHAEAKGVLEDVPSKINQRNDLDELSEKKWHGVVFLRRLHSARLEEAPGWHGRVLIRAGCLFFGDKEMLKQIDKDLR